MPYYYPNKPGPDLLVDMFNDQMGTNFLVTDFTFGNPLTLTNQSRNTAVVAEIATGPLTGSKTELQYNRLDLAMMIDSRSIEMPDTGAYVTVGDLLVDLNSTYGLELTTSDVEDNELVIDSYPVLVNLIAKPTSYLVYGQGLVKIMEPVVTP